MRNIYRLILLLIIIVPGFSQIRTASYLSPDPYYEKLRGLHLGPIALDSSGYKWISTDMGLNKTDESNWFHYNSSNTTEIDKVFCQEIPGIIHGFFYLAVDDNNRKWFVSDYGMTSLYNDEWTLYDTTNSPFNVDCFFRLSSMLLDNNYSVWVGTRYNGLFKFNQKEQKWTVFNDTNIFVYNDDIELLAVDKENTVWMKTYEKGLIRLKDNEWTLFNEQQDSIPLNKIYQIVVDKYNRKYMFTDLGLTVYNDTTWTIYTAENSGLPEGQYGSIGIESDSIIWVTVGKCLVKFDGQNWTVFDSTQIWLGKYNGYIRFIDKNGNKWISCSKYSAGIDNYYAIFNENGIAGPLDAGDGWIVTDPYEPVNIYPNPFTTSTNIVFDTEIPEHIEIAVMNPMGHIVRQIDYNQLQEGRNSINFDASDLPSGMYICRVIIDGKTYTKKILHVE